jgi:hypothetical protein
MSQATTHQAPEPEGRPMLLHPIRLGELVEVERERLAELVEANPAPVPLADAISAYVAELVAVAPPLSADLRARLAGLFNTEA